MLLTILFVGLLIRSYLDLNLFELIKTSESLHLKQRSLRYFSGCIKNKAVLKLVKLEPVHSRASLSLSQFDLGAQYPETQQGELGMV
ncbi:hypothetical protein [Comamonas sp. NoAH]|uniref:hypothetical protein n=1 Tax=Comamonas halotolerans TaxID=3041496 RepID=UPI0024E0829D|nr:hypothetical protein [Comamonas sp. NoAH]